MTSSATSATWSPMSRRELREAEVGAREVDHTATRATTPPTTRMIRRVRGLPPPPRATFSARSLAAVVVRSSITAITTIRAPGTNAPPTSLMRQAGEHRLAEARAVDEGRERGHRERRQRGLVEADDDRLARHRELDLAQPLPVGLTRRVGGLDGRRRHLPDAEAGDPDQGRQRVDQGAHDGAADADAEEQHDRQQVDEGRHGLQEVQDRRQDPGRPSLVPNSTASGSPTTSTITTRQAVTMSRSIESSQ